MPDALLHAAVGFRSLAGFQQPNGWSKASGMNASPTKSRAPTAPVGAPFRGDALPQPREKTSPVNGRAVVGAPSGAMLFPNPAKKHRP
jgi:hypothetical protein